MINTEDFLTKKYEYDEIHKLNIEYALRKEDEHYQRVKEENLKKTKNFEEIKNKFLESKNSISETPKQNIDFLQKRIVEKSKDLEKNKQELDSLTSRKEKLFIELNKSNKKLELIYKKIEDIKIEKKIRKENIETSENVENFIIANKFQKIGKKEINFKKEAKEDFKIKGKISLNEKNEDKETSKICDIKDDALALENKIENTQNLESNNINILNNDATSFNFNFGEQHKGSQAESQTESYMTFQEFEKRISNLKSAKLGNQNTLSLQYNSETGSIYNLNLCDNASSVDVNIVINSYKDFLNLNQEKNKIISSLKEKGIKIKNINIKKNLGEVA